MQNNETSLIEASTAAPTTNVSVTKGGSKASEMSPYPNYFYTPKQNLFEKKRGSRYDKGHSQKPFHLTQPDTNFAKFIFSNAESKKRPGESQSMVNAYQPSP